MQQQKLICKHMIMINDTDYSNSFDNSNDNKKKINEQQK